MYNILYVSPYLAKLKKKKKSIAFLPSGGLFGPLVILIAMSLPVWISLSKKIYEIFVETADMS